MSWPMVVAAYRAVVLLRHDDDARRGDMVVALRVKARPRVQRGDRNAPGGVCVDTSHCRVRAGHGRKRGNSDKQSLHSVSRSDCSGLLSSSFGCAECFARSGTASMGFSQCTSPRLNHSASLVFRQDFRRRGSTGIFLTIWKILPVKKKSSLRGASENSVSSRSTSYPMACLIVGGIWKWL